MEPTIDKMTDLDSTEVALNQNLTAARAVVKELESPTDYRALLDPERAELGRTERERWRDRVQSLENGIKALKADRVAYIEQLDREAVQERVDKIQVVAQKKNAIAQKLQDLLVPVAHHIQMMAANDQDLIELLDYQSTNPVILTPAGWEVADSVHHLRDWSWSKKLAMEELGRLLNGKQPGELLAIVETFGWKAQRQWATWYYHTRIAKRKQAAELAAAEAKKAEPPKLGAKPSGSAGAAALRVVGG